VVKIDSGRRRSATVDMSRNILVVRRAAWVDSDPSVCASSHAAIRRRRRSNLLWTRLAHSKRKVRSELVRMPLAALTYRMMRLYSAAASCWFRRAVPGFRTIGVTLLMSWRRHCFSAAVLHQKGNFLLENEPIRKRHSGPYVTDVAILRPETAVPSAYSFDCVFGVYFGTGSG
jgi:hypothetical protein